MHFASQSLESFHTPAKVGEGGGQSKGKARSSSETSMAFQAFHVRCSKCFQVAWQKVRKGTGYVNVSELPDDEESTGSKCEPFSFGDVS